MDRQGGGVSTVIALQSPFGAADGTIVVGTENPNFCQKGDVVAISGTNTLLDAYHSVQSVIDETHIILKPDTQTFLDGIPQLVIYLNGASSPPTTLDIVQSVQLTSASSGNLELLLSLKDKSANYDVSTFTGLPVTFAVDPSFYPPLGTLRQEWAYATATIGAVETTAGSTYPNVMVLYVTYPSWVMQTANAQLTRVANADLPVFDAAGPYYSRCVISPSRYDFSRGHRFVYVALSLDTKTVGSMMLPTVPGKRMFSRIPLSAGRDAVTFIGKNTAEGSVTLSTPVPTVRTIGITVYSSDGQQYNFQGCEWSLTLAFACKTPLQ